jgi:phosphoserine phosphatase RsbU/P
MTVRIGRLEIAFGIGLIVYMCLAVAGETSAIRSVLKSILLILGAWVFIRISRAIVQKMLWRLRNRLIVAYFFIAVVPIILITLLAGLGVALVGGQISIYLVTSELERRTVNLRSTVDFLASDLVKTTEMAATVAQFLETRFPGVQIVIRDGGLWAFPQNGNVPTPSADWPQGNGLMVRDEHLYGWAAATHGGRTVFAAFPVTREFVGVLVPDIGESIVVNIERDHVLLHPSLPDASTPSRNRLLPAVNVFDFQIPWGAPILTNRWENPSKVETEWLTMRTRPSAVLRTVLSQKIDFATEMIPMLFFGAAILFLIAEVIAFLIGISLTRTITGAVHELYEGTLRVRSGDLQHRIPAGSKDQLGELSDSFNDMTENMERLLSIEKERERLQAELEIAREVQNQLYPKRLPDVQTLRLTAVCNPARMVSGDYYDYQQVGDTNVAIAIGDVAGKGISAALLMATVQSSFRAQLRGSLELAAMAGQDGMRASVSTSRVVSHLNQQLYADTAPEKYATFFLGVYDEIYSTLTYTNAGHLPPILIRNGDATRFEVNGMVVGAFPFAKYNESRIQLLRGDLVVFYTDGITEPENAYGEMFGEERMIELVARNAHCDESKIVGAITDAVREWTGTDELQDDMTLLLVRQL